MFVSKSGMCYGELTPRDNPSPAAVFQSTNAFGLIGHIQSLCQLDNIIKPNTRYRTGAESNTICSAKIQSWIAKNRLFAIESKVFFVSDHSPSVGHGFDKPRQS
jgi:hypothetical protein